MSPLKLLLPLLVIVPVLLAGFIAAVDELQILLDVKASLGITNSTAGFESWSSDSKSTCHFSGILCDASGSVAEIDLSDRGDISGTLPLGSLCQLPSLTKLALGFNYLSGELTDDLLNCTSLKHLDLASNVLSGKVPDVSGLVNLQALNLSDNQFTGQFPWSSLGNLTRLSSLSLGDNFFDPSPFPEAVTRLRRLTWLYLSDCNLQGGVPPSIGNLTALIDLEFADNFLSGGIPPEIAKLSNLWQLEIYNNSIAGTIPKGFGNLSNLAYFDASMNSLEGNLSELRFLNKLESLQLFYNGFSGEIPVEFGEFKSLVNLSLYSNRLSGELPEQLGSWSEFNFIDVSTNYLSGKIPPAMCQMGTMQKLLMLENNFTGEIPASYGGCKSLTRFRVSNNSLSGVVPPGIWSLPNVDIIDLAVNNFEGPIDAGIGHAKSLYQLFINRNRFSGELPAAISGAAALVSIDVSFNQLSGRIPASIGNLKSLMSLDLQKNNFSGEIPGALGWCVKLNAVNLSGNSLSGPIPASFGGLPTLNSLDLSVNQLSGQIPSSLSYLKLSALDLSKNHLSGEVPGPLAIDAFNTSFAGNPALCSQNSIRFLQRCSAGPGRGSSETVHVVVTCVLVGFAVIVTVVGCLKISKMRRYRRNGSLLGRESRDLKSFRILSFEEEEIIDGIREENLIGRGGSGSVYRVELSGGNVVAVKHIWRSSPDSVSVGSDAALAMLGGERRREGSPSAVREFEAEVTALSGIRHVNVVKLYCSVTCEEWKLLVYEYLPNGSLWEWLHTCEGAKAGGLGWDQRLEVAVGAARGLEYLHHGCERPIVHRDVKSSNILLDERLKPRIADFGLAKILNAGGEKDATTTHVIAGTHGYIPPEYAYTWKVNEKGDVYSLGVVLMELVTGRRPIEAEYGENKDIVHWVSGKLTSRQDVHGVVDSRIPEWAWDEVVRVLYIAVLCTARLPVMRPTMRKVVKTLEEVSAGRDIELYDGKKVRFKD